MDLAAPGLENRLVRFEPLSEAHRDILLSDELAKAIWKWMPPLPKGTSLEQYFGYILASQKCGANATYVLFFKDDDAFAGVTGFTSIDKLHRRLRIAFGWFTPARVTADLFLLTQLSLIERAVTWGARRIEWHVYPKNTFYLKHLAEVGPQKEAVLRQAMRMADGEWTDRIVFSMTRDEAKRAIKRLETA